MDSSVLILASVRVLSSLNLETRLSLLLSWSRAAGSASVASVLLLAAEWVGAGGSQAPAGGLSLFGNCFLQGAQQGQGRLAQPLGPFMLLSPES